MQKTNSELTSIDHVLVNINNIEESVKWYQSSFECEVLYRSKTLAVLQFSNIKIVLSLPSEQRPHLGIQKSEASSFGELMEQSDLCISTFIADPSGNPIELVATPIDNHPELTK
jgi:catechol 2,3-dioxygenase-like lactoylglutathione lyase family enzyme